MDESDGNYSRGDLSLREAIGLANQWSSTDTIHFDPAFTANGPATILLVMGELKVTDDVTISGPGSSLLTLDASGSDPTPTLKDSNGSRIFNLDDSSVNLIECSISGLRLTGGDVKGSGGAVRDVEKLSLRDVLAERNTASESGGGVFVSISGISGSFAMDSSVVIGNSSKNGGGGGVALQVTFGANVSITGSDFRTNTSSGTTAAGGGLRITGGSGEGQILIENNEFSGNTTGGTTVNGGGALHRSKRIRRFNT